MVPSQTMIISIQTLDTRYLIFTCKIPANFPYHPRRGSPRWPRSHAEKRPDTVGHPQSADDSAAHMPLLQAQKY